MSMLLIVRINPARFANYILKFAKRGEILPKDDIAKKRPKAPKPLTENDLMKLEIAQELGVTDKIAAGGWKSLTAKESGRIGGIMASRKRAEKAGK